MILVYTEEITPRLEYIFSLIFEQLLKTPVQFTTNSSEFIKSDTPKLNYSPEKFGEEFYIKPHRLLFCKVLIALNINPVWYEGNKYFCESSADSDLPFDPFAASFFVVSRYEEYLKNERDKFGRFQAKNSILFKYNLLQKPVVNIWAQLLAKKLSSKYSKITFSKTKFNFISTIDIDNAFAFQHKGYWRSSGALIKSLLHGNKQEFNTRREVLSGKISDPYDTYNYLDQVFEGNEEKVLFFFLLGDYSRFDKNISHKNKYLKKLIQQIDKKYETGLHPSFLSAKKKAKKRVLMEKSRLEEICGHDIINSRQHYLRLKFPRTYRRLIKAGIKNDFTMGYAEQCGFRAGICTPYKFYDLKNESTTDLQIVPFQVMDGTLRQYLQLSPQNAIDEINKLLLEVKKVGGTFVSIWHNETLSDTGYWKGYREVFEQMNKQGFDWANE